jgi:hypothetical protein
MDPLVGLLLKNGVFGILAGVGFYLYFRERKINFDNNKAVLKQSVEDAAAKTRLAIALEDLVITVGTLEKNSKDDLTKQREQCKEDLGKMCDIINDHTVNERIKEARADERRRTLSSPSIRTGEDDDPSR